MRKAILQLKALAVFVCLAGPSASHAQVFPQRVSPEAVGGLPYSATVLVEAQIRTSDFFRGSGVVARDARLLFSCAHTAFENGVWATNLGVAVGWNAAVDAPRYRVLRGYRTMAGYAATALRGSETPQAFSLDFIVGFNDTPLGPVIPAIEQGSGFLRQSGVQKMILGYPSSLDHNGSQGGFFMHRTGPFTGTFYTELGAYLGLDGVSTGSGNSGGPVLVNSQDGWSLAGILVSGTNNSIGVHAIESAAWQVSTSALVALGAPPSPTPTPNPGGDSPPPSGILAELLAQRTSLMTRLSQARLIRNPTARAIQLRRLRSMLAQVNIQIANFS